MLKLQRGLIWSLFLAGAFAAQSFAQGGATGAITGTVQDTSGASIANAQVRITNQATRTLDTHSANGAGWLLHCAVAAGGLLFLGHQQRRFCPETIQRHCGSHHRNYPRDRQVGPASGESERGGSGGGAGS